MAGDNILQSSKEIFLSLLRGMVLSISLSRTQFLKMLLLSISSYMNTAQNPLVYHK